MAIVIGAGALPSGDGPARVAVPEEAAAAPLVRLAARIQTEPAPAGDATLVLRRHAFPDEEGFTGADLYLDDGRYFYAETRAGLREAAPRRRSSGSARSLPRRPRSNCPPRRRASG